ncbi:nickel pincer cofactor biosynthesis protein LarB [Gloeobacter violaceus]|uniref:Gll1462 protein n=1 Tax=Gloeobacter violaceus (strain ATCC 29082 / PCC 7421) TaxID=251221 RepID=Q7NKL5_GLOVI|nr:nickel pincer cofactor biosynthesis protein LarB [Gloeobacter violaceus]BAC89403.1 gll1462 [Gloeobacter violaceus PCC 7421]
MNAELLKQLLQSVADGNLQVTEALEKLRTFQVESLDFAKLDHHRALRTGFPEVVWGPGKTFEQIAAILARLSEHNSVAMATRIDPATFEQVRGRLPEVRYYSQARICAVFNPRLPPNQIAGCVGVVSAGTADLPVADEAAVTAELCGAEVLRLWDVGVAGIHRLLSNLSALEQADVLVVVAGMEGALASVVGGLARVPVIAVPTSVGYGAHFGGLAALLAMLNSCAPGIGVVNIDNGFGAAMLAAQILRVAERKHLAASQTPPDRSAQSNQK